MKKLVRTSLLVLALSCTAYAGNMPTPAPSPESQTTQAVTQATTVSDPQDRSATAGLAAEAALNLVGLVLSQF